MTLQWIIDTLKKSGCNSKQTVIEALGNISEKDLVELGEDCYSKAEFINFEKQMKKLNSMVGSWWNGYPPYDPS